MKLTSADVRSIIRDEVIDNLPDETLADAVLDVVSGYDIEGMVKEIVRDKVADRLYEYVSDYIDEAVGDCVDSYLEEVFC